MKPPDPVIVAHLFPELLKKLLEVLTSLGPDEWKKPTPCPAWSVHDLALHLLGVDVGELSRGRDRFETFISARLYRSGSPSARPGSARHKCDWSVRRCSILTVGC